MTRLRYVTPWLFLLLFLGLAAILRGSKTASTIGSNFGWVNLNRHRGQETSAGIDLGAELTAFSNATAINKDNRSAWFGLGLTYALQRCSDEAINSWSQPVIDPATSVAFGLDARRNGERDMALTHFRAADILAKTKTGEERFLADTICQRTLANPNQLSPSNQRYCSQFLADNGGNLVVNANFSTASVAGWSGDNFIVGTGSERLEIVPVATEDNFAVRLDGLVDNNHLGLYQRLALSPGDRVRFSGRFKLSGDNNLSARILFISWQNEDGTVQGNHGEQWATDIDWSAFERTFTVPADSRANIDFYPLLFSGQGSVWFDAIRLELIPN